MHALDITVADEPVVLRADRCLYWPRKATLFVADLHLGKGAAFRALGVPLPSGSTESTLHRLDASIQRSPVRRLVMLGDLWHAKSGRTAGAMGSFEAWRRRHPDVEVVLVRGNHDLRSGGLPASLHVLEVDEGEADPPFSFLHYPGATEGAFSLAGHLHPCVELSGIGRQRIHLPCFWIGDHCAVLPAYGDFTGCAEIEPRPQDQVFAIGDQRVVRVPHAAARR